MEDELILKEATEPTNIIWENRHHTSADYAKRTLQVVAIVACLLAVSFMAIYFCKTYAIDNARVYPQIDMKKIFTETFNSNKVTLQTYARQEYEDFVAHDTPLAIRPTVTPTMETVQTPFAIVLPLTSSRPLVQTKPSPLVSSLSTSS